MRRASLLIITVIAALLTASASFADVSVKQLLKDSGTAAKAGDYKAQIGYLEQIASGYPDSNYAPKAIYDMAEVYRARLKSPQEAMYFYWLLAQRYPASKLSTKALQINAKLAEKGHRIKAPEGRALPRYDTPGPGRAGADGVGPVKQLLDGSKKAAKARDYEGQAAYLEQVASYYPESKYAQKALYDIAEIYRTRLNRPSEAMSYYSRLMAVYPGSKLSTKALALSAKLSKQGYRSGETAAAVPVLKAPAERTAALPVDREAPLIEITSPVFTGGKATSNQKQLKVEGKVSDPSGIVEVTFNGKEARLDSGGKFRVDMYLVYGDNDITVTAMDREGNRSTGNFTIVRQGALAKTGPALEIDKGLPSTRTRNPDAIAVVIGNSSYKKAKDVAYAVNDAKLMKTYLVDVLGYKVGNIFYYENASKSDFEILFGNSTNHMGKLFNAVKKDRSDIFIYYSGHGAPGLKDKRGYFVPSEADPQYIELSGYSTDVFYANLAKVPARSTTIVLDACFSGADIFENISPIVLEVENPSLELSNAVVFSSSTGSQVSSWYNDKEHGMFTYFFLKAIHNRNADADKDGSLTFEEIYQYISDNSEGVPYYARRIHGVEQNPTIEGQFRDRVLLRY